MTELEHFALPGSVPASHPAPLPIPLTSKHLCPCRNAKSKSKKPIVSADPAVHDFGSTIQKLWKISASINFPRSRTQDFWLFCKAKALKEMKAVHDNDTRWNGTCNMIERGIYLRPAIDPWIQTRPELKEFTLSDREWELAEFLLRFLEPFRHATNLIQATERPSLHKTFVMYEKLYNNLENVKAIFNKMTTVPEWFQEVQNAIDEM
jgi:hypothetical protein